MVPKGYCEIYRGGGVFYIFLGSPIFHGGCLKYFWGLQIFEFPPIRLMSEAGTLADWNALLLIRRFPTCTKIVVLYFRVLSQLDNQYLLDFCKNRMNKCGTNNQ